jgi:hypothetical protein
VTSPFERLTRPSRTSADHFKLLYFPSAQTSSTLFTSYTSNHITPRGHWRLSQSLFSYPPPGLTYLTRPMGRADSSCDLTSNSFEISSEHYTPRLRSFQALGQICSIHPCHHHEYRQLLHHTCRMLCSGGRRTFAVTTTP